MNEALLKAPFFRKLVSIYISLLILYDDGKNCTPLSVIIINNYYYFYSDSFKFQ